jgi:flagellar FliJ protein
MSWSESLIKLATYEVEVRQIRLAQIADRRDAAEQQLARLTAEGEAELARAGQDAAADLQLTAYLQGLRIRKATVHAEIAALIDEERGARDALSEAFEEQKKYEHVAETARRLEARETARRETAALDELGLRKAMRR